MKKLFVIFVLIMFIVPAIAMADNKGGFTGGGFKDEVSIVSVADAQTMRDDTYVILEGKIEKRINDDDYLFRDATGSIVVEIDDDDWQGVTVGPEDTVVLYGEVDRDFTRVEIDVDRVVKR